MQVLISGGAGFIGGQLADRLVRRDWVGSVTVLDDGTSGDLEQFDDGSVRVEHASVLDRDRLDHLVGRADAVVHLAARWEQGAGLADPLGVHDVNATGTTRVLEAAVRNGASQVVVCGWPTRPEGAGDPLSASFEAAAAAVAGYRSGLGLRVLELRLADVVGAGRPAGHPRGGWLDAMVDAALDDLPVPMHGDGRTSRSVVDVRTVVDVVERGLRLGIAAPTPLDLAGPATITELEVLTHLATRMDRTLTIRALDAAPRGPQSRVVDPLRIAARFPGVAPHPISDTIDDMVAARRPVALL